MVEVHRGGATVVPADPTPAPEESDRSCLAGSSSLVGGRLSLPGVHARPYTENDAGLLAHLAGIAEDALMTIKLSLELVLPDSSDVTQVVYLLKATRRLVESFWPGARLVCHPAFIRGPKK